MVITAFIIAFHKPKTRTEPYRKFNRDSLVFLKQQDSIRRAAKYQAVRDSYAQLKAERLARKQAREAAYQAMMDSFSELRRQRQAIKEAREAEWSRKRDSLQSLRPKKLSEGETVDLNTCDTTLLLQVPGIGRYYAQAIIRYREKLGGFYSIHQVLEIPDFPEKAVPYLRMDKIRIHRINVNNATLNDLRKHPYISYAQAKAILEYRNKYGKIQSIAQLSLLDEFTPTDIERMNYYLTY